MIVSNALVKVGHPQVNYRKKNPESFAALGVFSFGDSALIIY
jgi:hypothetical protein